MTSKLQMTNGHLPRAGRPVRAHRGLMRLGGVAAAEYSALVELAEDAGGEAQGGQDPGDPPRLRPATEEPPSRMPHGGSGGPSGVAAIVDALKSSAEQELTIAERLASKARQAFALGAGVFVIAQTVAFGSFNSSKITAHEQHWIIGLAVGAVVLLGFAAIATLKADSTVESGDLPLAKLEDDLNAAHDGDSEVVGRLGGYYLGVVRSRRNANSARRGSYKRARLAVVLSLATTVAELIVALVARTT